MDYPLYWIFSRQANSVNENRGRKNMPKWPEKFSDANTAAILRLFFFIFLSLLNINASSAYFYRKHIYLAFISIIFQSLVFFLLLLPFVLAISIYSSRPIIFFFLARVLHKNFPTNTWTFDAYSKKKLWLHFNNTHWIVVRYVSTTTEKKKFDIYRRKTSDEVEKAKMTKVVKIVDK